MGVLSMLKLLGLPTENENGHEIGCSCDGCHELRRQREREIRERIRRGSPPKTVGELLAEAQRKRRERMH